MARQEIDLTTPQPNGKMGEPTKSAWEKVNDMTEELYPMAEGAQATANSALSQSDSAVRISANGYSVGNDANNPGGVAGSGLRLYAFADGSTNTPLSSWTTLASFSPFADGGGQFQIAYSWNAGAFHIRFVGGAWYSLWHTGNTTVDSNNFIKRA